MESVVKDYLKASLKNQNYYPLYRGGPVFAVEEMTDDSVESSALK